MSKSQPEYNLQKNIITWLKHQYPDVFFMSDTVASIKLTPQQQARNKAIQCQKFSCMDLIILEPIGNYHGLCIELKIETPFKKDGTIKASQNNHLKKQWDSILKMKSKGYYACFSWHFEDTINLIKNYLKGQL